MSRPDSSDWTGDFGRDTRRAVRSLLRAPGFSLIAIITIALGVGATTAVVSAGYSLLRHGMPGPDASRLISIDEMRDGSVNQGPEGMLVPFARYERYREALHSIFVDVAGHEYGTVSLSWNASAASAPMSLVTRNFFTVLGFRPAAGRFIGADTGDGIVISNRLWRSRFGADRGVVGTGVLLDGAPFTIIGVAPPAFEGTTRPFVQDVWIPIDAAHFGGVGNQRVGLFGRLQPGVTQADADSYIQMTAKRIPPDEKQTHVFGAHVQMLTGLPYQMQDGLAKFLVILLLTAVLVLLIAAANLAGMQLTRAAARRREIAVQLAIGANRSRMVRQLLTETILLFVAGGTGGILIAVAATRLISRITPPIAVPLEINVSPNWWVLAGALALSLLTGIIFGLAPAMGSTKLNLVSSLKNGSPSGATRTARGRSWFVSGQITIAVVLLVVAGLFVRTLNKATHVELGFNPDNIYVGRVNLDALHYGQAKEDVFFQNVVRRLRQDRDIQNVSLAHRSLMSGNNASEDVHSGSGAGERSANARINAIDTAYFATLGMRMIAGRSFTGRDVSGAPLVSVINQKMAAELWPGESPLGKTFRKGQSEILVVGVVADAKYDFVTEAPRAFMYFPLAQTPSSALVLNVRSTAPAGDVLARMQKAVNAVDPAVAVSGGMPQSAAVETTMFPQRFAAWLVGAFGLIGLVLAVLGVYGVLSFQVAQRTREFGIRVALGATENDVLGGVLRLGAKLALVGGVAGLAIAAYATRLLHTFIYGISALDPVTFIAVPLLLFGVALVASYVPAKRATMVSPIVALRSE